jgi:hypothetical protein
MLVGDEDVLHPLLALHIGEDAEGTRVDRHLVIDEKRHEKLEVGWRNARIQQFDTHGLVASGFVGGW